MPHTQAKNQAKAKVKGQLVQKLKRTDVINDDNQSNYLPR